MDAAVRRRVLGERHRPACRRPTPRVAVGSIGVVRPIAAGARAVGSIGAVRPMAAEARAGARVVVGPTAVVRPMAAEARVAARVAVSPTGVVHPMAVGNLTGVVRPMAVGAAKAARRSGHCRYCAGPRRPARHPSAAPGGAVAQGWRADAMTSIARPAPLDLPVTRFLPTRFGPVP
jgi:hypothetical protein